MISINHNGRTYYRSQYHWQVTYLRQTGSRRAISYRRLTPQRNAALISTLEARLKQFINNMHTPM